MVTIWLSSWSKSYYIDSICSFWSFLLLWFLVKLGLTDKAFKLHQDGTHCLTLSTPPFRSAAGKEELCDGLNLVATHCRCLWCLVTWATIHLIFGNNQYGFALWVLRENAMTNVPMAQCKLGYCCNLSNSNYLWASSDPTLDQFHIFLSYVRENTCFALLRSDWMSSPFFYFTVVFLWARNLSRSCDARSQGLRWLRWRIFYAGFVALLLESLLCPEVLLIIREFRTTERLARDSDGCSWAQLTSRGLGWRMFLPCRKFQYSYSI